MMTEGAHFTGLETFRLVGVQVSDKQFGHGSYATVQELEYMGLKCAGKKIHDLLLQQGDASYTLRRFEDECRILSQVRHPNIVQFLGVHFQRGVRVPILVMEYLPTNLTSCIEHYGIFPKEISYSILHNVALGLYYLHNQTPPIIHRDLSSNNVLLTANMTGKISDLGVARILNLTPLQVSRMTQTPGTPAFMPPEVMVANPKYDTSVDEFSYGILMIHMFSGRWPEPQVGPNRTEGDELIPVSEAERREVFLQAIGNDHPLMDLIKKCVNNNPHRRAHASEIVERLARMTSQHQASVTNRLELMRRADQHEEEKHVLREKRKQVQTELDKISRQNLVYSSEVEQLKLQNRDLISQKECLTAESEATITNLKTNIEVATAQIEDNIQERQRFEERIAKQVEESNALKAELGCQLSTHMRQINELRKEISQLKMDTNFLQHKVVTMEAENSRNKATIVAKSRALEEKDIIISGMCQQLARARDYLASKPQVSKKMLFKICENKHCEKFIAVVS